MSKLENLLSKKELDHLANVIADAEKSTSGEIRLMLVSRSSRTSHVFPLLVFLFSTLSLLYIWYSRHMILISGNDWLVPAGLLGSALLAAVLSRFQMVHRRFTWPDELENQVLMRAEVEFHREGLSATSGGTGILIFLSLLERQAVVLADKGIAEKLDKKVWSEVVGLVLEGARAKKLAPKLEEAVRKCGVLLSTHFPIQPGDKNELPNHVIVKN